MADDVIRSAAIGVPHGFLDAAQSDAKATALAVGDAAIGYVKQIHSARALGVMRPFADGDLPEADAMVTDQTGCALAIVTADCAPVLLADKAAGVIGAAHAGWRGAQSGVIANTVAQMECLGAHASAITAAIGPCIAQDSYEVGADMRDHFEMSDHRFFKSTGAQKWHFDLVGFVASRLQQAGVSSVDCLRIDTYASEGRFHSYRRATHQSRPTKGRQISLIALEG